MTIVKRPSCWYQNFGPNGLSAPTLGICLNFFSSITADFNISSVLRWAIQDQWSSGWYSLSRVSPIDSLNIFSTQNWDLFNKLLPEQKALTAQTVVTLNFGSHTKCSFAVLVLQSKVAGSIPRYSSLSDEYKTHWTKTLVKRLSFPIIFEIRHNLHFRNLVNCSVSPVRIIQYHSSPVESLTNAKGLTYKSLQTRVQFTCALLHT